MLNLVDRLLVIDNGRLIADGPTQEVLDRLREAAATLPQEGAKA
jgi:ABC-type branched-subunit amino acid transport system ATPase component